MPITPSVRGLTSPPPEKKQEPRGKGKKRDKDKSKDKKDKKPQTKKWGDPAQIREIEKGINKRWEAEKRRWLDRNLGAGKEIARQKVEKDEIRRKAQIADTKRIKRILAPGTSLRQKYIEKIESSIEEKEKANRIHIIEDNMLKALKNEDFAKTITIIWEMLDITFKRYKGSSDIIGKLKNDPLAAFPHLLLLYSKGDIERLFEPKYNI